MKRRTFQMEVAGGAGAVGARSTLAALALRLGGDLRRYVRNPQTL